MGRIRLHNVCKHFPVANGGRLAVLDKITFDIRDRTFISILGPSGCGKSTILNLIAGLDRPASGDITSDATRIGFVFQQPRLLNWRTVVENVELPLERTNLDRSKRRETALRHLSLVGLSGYESYYPLQLSGGMQQRVAIARALVVDPEILLMDEPFSGLDEWTARNMREELIRIWTETGTTVVFVTHSINESVFLSEQILIVTHKPATIYKTVAIDLPYPRSYEDVRLFEIAAGLSRDFMSMSSRGTSPAG